MTEATHSSAPKTTAADWLLRPAVQEDYAFILDSWHKSTRDEQWAGNVPNHMFMAVLKESVRQLVVRGAKITVCANPGRPGQIVGWLCSENGRNGEQVVHALYCKRPFRRMGVARVLLGSVGLRPDDPFPFTYKTRMSRAFPNSKHLPAIQRREKI